MLEGWFAGEDVSVESCDEILLLSNEGGEELKSEENEQK